MPDQTPELTAIMSRLERVERENGRMKQAALGILVVVSGLKNQTAPAIWNAVLAA